MRIAPDGGYGPSAPSDTSTNTNTPTPAQQQAKVTTAQAAVNQDKSRLQSTQNTLNQVENQEDARVQQMMALQKAVAALQAQLKADEAAVAADQKDLDKSVSSDVTHQTNQSVKTYGLAASHAPGAPTAATATSGLETAAFNQEVLVYEQTHGGQCWVPGSKQWQQDAQALLADPPSLQSTRDVVASQEVSSLSSNGLDIQRFGAMEWAGETVARAQLQDPQAGYAAPGTKPTLAQEAQGEQNAINSLSSALTSLPNSGVDPALARQALFSNQYVSGTLGQEIVRTMQSVSTSSNKTQADGIGFLYHLLGNSSVDPQLATTLISAAAPTLQSYLQSQSSASKDQASQAYAYTAGLYDVLENAQQAGVPGADALAGKLAQWSFAAANSTDAALQRSVAGRAGMIVEKNSSKLDGLLPEVQQKIKQQHLPSNLLFAWRAQSQGVSNTGALTDNQSAWANFNKSLQGDGSLKARPLAGAKIPTTPTAGLTADQVHSTYDSALNLLNAEQRNGALPSGANSTTLAAIQTEMAGGYGAQGNDAALARAMISSQQQQLDQTWQQNDNGQAGVMPVNALNAQAASQVAGMSSALGVDARSWAAAVKQGDQGMQAADANAPGQTVIDHTNEAYTNLQKAEASGDHAAIAKAQEGWDEALTSELQAVYGTRFSGYSLLSDDENGNWRYMAEVQVMRDHAGSTDMIKAVSNGLEASEIVELSVGGGQSAPQSVTTLDQELAPLQPKGADPGGITQAVLNDARVQSLINGQVSAATRGTADEPTAALEQETKILAPYEANDPNGVVSGQIIKNTLGGSLTTEILSNARSAVDQGRNALSVAAPLMQAAQLSPSLTLAVYHTFDLPPPDAGTAGASAAATGSSKGPANQLTAAAGSVNSAADYRNLAIIYATLPDDPQTVGVSDQPRQAQGAKSALLQAFGAELNQPNSVAGKNIRSWIQSSFSGSSSAPAWLANDLVAGYSFDQGGKTQTVGKLGNSDLVSTIKEALYQPGEKSDSSSIGPSSVVDMSAAATADGSTLREFTSRDELTGYVAQAYGLQPTGSGSYDPNTVVFGNTTLGQIISALERQAGIGPVSTATPIVVQAAPVTVGEQQAAEFRVQKQDGSTVWLGADGSVTQDWAGQDSSLTHDVKATTLQVVGGVTEHDATGSADLLLKTDTVKAPPKPWWEDVAKDALALTAAIVVTAAGGDVIGGIAAAFAVEQLFDMATHDGEMTVFQYADDAIHGKVGWKETGQFAVDSGIELINAVADAAGAGAASAISSKIATAVGTKVLAGVATSAATDAVTDTATTAATETVSTAATDTVSAAATETVSTAATDTVSAVTTETAASASTMATTEGTTVEAATAATTDAGGTAGEVTAEQAAKEAAAKAAAKQAAREAGLRTIKGRLLASAGGAAVQQTIQGTANLVTSSITMVSRGDFTWSAFGRDAAQQGVNLTLSTAAGGFSGVLPANFLVQTAAGFGTNMAQTEADDQLFDHQNLTQQDVLAGLIMMTPTTLQQYADRPGGMDMLNQALTGGAGDGDPPPVSATGSEAEEGAAWPRPEPVLANATYLLDNTRKLIDRIPVEIHEDHITTDYSTTQARRAERIAANLRLDINMFFEECLQRQLEHNGALTGYARKAVELIHDRLEFTSMDPSIKGPELDRTGLRAAQLRTLTQALEGYFPEGALRQFLDDGDWSEDRFNAFLGTFTGEKGGRAQQIAVTGMKVLRQINTQVPYFGGSIEYEQNERGLEYYIYHISTLTRDPEQQLGVDTEQGSLLPRDLKTYRTNAEGKVPFGNLRNLGEGATDAKMTFDGWPPELRKRAEAELDRLRTDPGAADARQVEWLNAFEAAWRQQSGQTTTPSLAELWNGSNEDQKKHIFSDILRLPWSADHLHGGSGYDQTTTAGDLQTASFDLDKLPSPPDGKPGLMNVAGVFANFLLKPEVASQQYVTDPKFVAVQAAFEDGRLAELFPGSVPPGDPSLQVQFEKLHGQWHADAMVNFKPIVGGISGHTLGYINLYDEALSKVPENERAQYPTPEQMRAIMLAGLIGTKRHHSYDEVMSASTSTLSDSVPAQSYQHPNSYEDVLNSEDPLIREAAGKALAETRERYTQSSNTVLATIRSALESNPKIPRKKIDKLTEAVSQYLQGLGGDQAQESRKFSRAVAGSLRPNVILAVKEQVQKIRQSGR